MVMWHPRQVSAKVCAYCTPFLASLWQFYSCDLLAWKCFTARGDSSTLSRDVFWEETDHPTTCTISVSCSPSCSGCCCFLWELRFRCWPKTGVMEIVFTSTRSPSWRWVLEIWYHSRGISAYLLQCSGWQPFQISCMGLRHFRWSDVLPRAR